MANIEIYTKATCPFCHRAKALLNSKGVTFQELPIDGDATKREEMIQRLGKGPAPQLYLIVATGNIYEDIKQATAAAHQGADIIAVIRTTGQSLLDYVPYGPTTSGFGGTYATQANFRILREALDEVSRGLTRTGAGPAAAATTDHPYYWAPFILMGNWL